MGRAIPETHGPPGHGVAMLPSRPGTGFDISLVARESALLLLTGIPLGVLSSLALSRLVTRLLYGVEPGDPLALGVSVLVLAGGGRHRVVAARQARRTRRSARGVAIRVSREGVVV